MPFCARSRLVASLLAILFSASAIAQVPQSEHDALVAFFNSTGGGGWTDKTGWNGAAGTECSWFGVQCDDTATHVTAIQLGNDNLSGTLPSLDGLPSLAAFVADANNLTGSIPSLSGLANLSYFNVSTNQLTGSIPALTNLPALSVFDVSFNQLSGSIPPLQGLPNLQQIYLGFNQLNGTIPTLTGLGNLQDFVVDNNLLTGSIPSLSGLGNLQVFNAGNNQIAGSLPALSGLATLQSFDVDSDQLTGTIPDLAGLSQLTFFSVARNQLTGSMPSLSGLANLQSFDVSYNQLGGSIPALSGLGKLQSLYLGFNHITGPIPALSGLGNLQNFIVDDNQLGGSIPPLSGLGSLQDFNAGTNQLSGSIPALSGLNNLSYFSVTQNQLVGSIPALSGLVNLGFFDASYNQLTGPIPALSGLRNLQIFYLGFNQLSGPIPSLSGLANLQEFAVDDNQIGGSIPSLSGLGNLRDFLAATNQLTGTIPALTGLTGLQTFEVGNNLLTGAIPALPAPDNLTAGLSSLCPNALAPTPDSGWDAATGLNPWYSTCAAVESKTADDAPTTKDSTNIALSDDGAIKVFQSQQTDLTSNTANSGGQDIYSVGADGQAILESIDESGNKLIGTSSLPAISPDGKVVAFLFTPSAAKNAKDAVTGEMFTGPIGQAKHQVDVGMGGVPPNGSASGSPSLSSVNGTNQLAFCSSASNLVPGDSNGAHDIFMVDPLNPLVAAQRISVDSNGNEIAGDSCEPKLSADGTKVVFSVSAPSLFGTQARQVVLKDLGGPAKQLVTGQMLLVSSTPGSATQGANADSSEPTVSADGSVVAFTSQASNLDGMGTPVGGKEVFVSLAHGSASAASRTVTRVRNGDGSVPDGPSEHPQLSDDGTTAVIQTGATNLLGSAPNQCGTMTVTTNFFSIATLGSTLCGDDGKTLNQSPAISGDGTATGFDSNAPQLNNAANRNTYAQGIGLNQGTGVANLSGDFSGQWYDPSQSGQGLVIDVTNPDANNGRVMILTWFVFVNGQPTWVQGVGVPKAGAGAAANTIVVQMNPVGIFRGTSFPLGQLVSKDPWGSITLTFTDANTGSMSWTTSYPGFTSGKMPIRHFLSVALPATDLATAKIKACYSGNWYNPGQSGHGFEFAVVPSATGPLLAVDWFAFAPSGAPVWLFNVGPIVGNTAQMPLGLIDGIGAQFPPNFDSAQITVHTWGTATFTFSDSAHAHVTWNSTIPGYGSGQLDIQPTLGAGLLDRRGCQ